jgi:hypothetical protein
VVSCGRNCALSPFRLCLVGMRSLLSNWLAYSIKQWKIDAAPLLETLARAFTFCYLSLATESPLCVSATDNKR